MNTPTDVSDRPSPLEGRCHFFVERKRRYCRLHHSKTSNYCAEHIPICQTDAGKKRVACPYNSKHTCFETKLQHHMKKCPSRPIEMPPYYVEGINSGDNAGDTVPDPKATVVTEQLEVVESIIEKVECLYKEHIGSIEEDILSHPCLQEELQKKGYGNSALRQRKQQASLIGQMEQMGMLKDGTCFLEMGAGKGQMSHWLHGAVENKKDIGFVLIERSHVRNKLDNLHKEEENGHVMERVKIDIEHLKLDKISTIANHDRRVVAFGKHLCGGATDLALRCVAETLSTGMTVNTQDADISHRKRLKSDRKVLSGVSIAMCCHHRCAWTPYVGKAFFKSCGFTVKDFQIICSMSSWATCVWKGWSYQKKCEKEKTLEKGDTVAGTEESKTKDGVQLIGNDGVKSDPIEGFVKTDTAGDVNQSNQDAPFEDTDKTMLKTTSIEDVNNLSTVKNSDKFATDNCDHEKIDKAGDMNKSSPDEVLDGEKAEQSDHAGNVEDVDEEHTAAEDFTNTRIQNKLSKAQREEIGRKCKQLIDYGRVQYLKEHNMTSCLKIYVEDFYTPENIVLLATS